MTPFFRRANIPPNCQVLLLNATAPTPRRTTRKRCSGCSGLQLERRVRYPRRLSSDDAGRLPSGPPNSLNSHHRRGRSGGDTQKSDHEPLAASVCRLSVHRSERSDKRPGSQAAPHHRVGTRGGDRGHAAASGRDAQCHAGPAQPSGARPRRARAHQQVSFNRADCPSRRRAAAVHDRPGGAGWYSGLVPCRSSCVRHRWAGAAMILGLSRGSAAVIGLALAMSSTAVVIQVLSEEKRQNTATAAPVSGCSSVRCISSYRQPGLLKPRNIRQIWSSARATYG